MKKKAERFSFPPPKDEQGNLLEREEEFSGVVVEEISKVFDRPGGKWEPIIQALKFDDGSFGIRFWYRTVRPSGKTVTARGMYLKDWTLESLRDEVKDTLVIKSLIKKLLE